MALVPRESERILHALRMKYGNASWITDHLIVALEQQFIITGQLPGKEDNDMSKSTVHTWADGFGVWHGRVEFARPTFAYDVTAARTKARRAIRKELLERSNGYDKLPDTKIELVAVKTDLGTGAVLSIEFREKV